MKLLFLTRFCCICCDSEGNWRSTLPTSTVNPTYVHAYDNNASVMLYEQETNMYKPQSILRKRRDSLQCDIGDMKNQGKERQRARVYPNHNKWLQQHRPIQFLFGKVAVRRPKKKKKKKNLSSLTLTKVIRPIKTV